MTTRVIVTGGAGFIGHYLIKHIIDNTDWEVIVIDKLTYASRGFKRLEIPELKNNPRLHIFTWDLTIPLSVGMKKELGDINTIFHLAAESHVDTSITHPVDFIHNNVMSTVYLLEYARELKNLHRFIYFSTDEVFGHAPTGVAYKEWDRHKPGNPYSASKSASEMICLSYENTYKLPLVMVNSMNVIGLRQESEKFLGLVMKKVLADEVVQIHADGECKSPGSRNYIHAKDIASAVMFVYNNGEIGEKYNISGEREVDNIEMAQLIANAIGKELKYNLVNFHATRPGHDLHYRLNGDKLTSMGWKVDVTVDDSIKEIVTWTLLNDEWLTDIY